ncbi:MAG: retropepsin-like aspartic protease [Candidatus Hydrogenedentota bacterium]
MTTIEFDATKKLIFLDAGIISIDGSEIFYVPVVMDTGATVTILSPDLLVNLGYDPASPNLPRIRMITGSGVEYAPCLIVSGLVVGEERVNNIEILCHDLPVEAGIDGLLGMNFLNKFDVIVEHSSSQFHLKPI